MFEIMVGSFFWVISSHVDLGLRERVWGRDGLRRWFAFYVAPSDYLIVIPAVWR